MSFLRTFLALSRAANLPTVWSNCLAGWWLGGGGNIRQLPLLFAGATLLYLSGTFLNDALDAGFDREYRRARPIPSGTLSEETVRNWGLVWLALGLAALFWLGKVTGGLGLALAFCALLFNFIHRTITFAPVLLGVCRFFLYVIGASIATDGVSGRSIWCGLALLAYAVGLRMFHAERGSMGPLRHWPLALLGVPILLALLMDVNEYRQAGLLLSAVLVLWVVRCVRYTLWSAPPNPGLTLSGLVAGIVLVDWLAVAEPRQLGVAFISLFLTVLLLQRLVAPPPGNAL